MRAECVIGKQASEALRNARSEIVQASLISAKFESFIIVSNDFYVWRDVEEDAFRVFFADCWIVHYYAQRLHFLPTTQHLDYSGNFSQVSRVVDYNDHVYIFFNATVALAIHLKSI